MGMAASQARLLTITARMHDVEYKAQNIMNEKIALATQKDDAYQDYLIALDAKKIQVGFSGDAGGTTYVDATFNTVCKYQEGRLKQYALHDSKSGKIVVDDEVYEAYTKGFNNDKYSFAWAMLGMGEMGSWDPRGGHCEFIGKGDQDDEEFLTMTQVERAVFYNMVDSNKNLKSAKEVLDGVTNDPDSTYTDKRNALDEFRDTLYEICGTQIYEYMCLDKQVDMYEAIENKEYDKNFDEDDFPKGEFNFYVHLFEEIQDAGGCISISNLNGGSENDNEWFNNMVNSGRLIISMYNEKGAHRGWKETSVATSTNENMLKEVQDDTDLKKAEAKYEHELSVINKKDSQYDQDLKKLETERSALKTEMDSIKKVKDDNIERTFGIFS